MSYDAGSAVAYYKIDLSQAEQSAARIHALWQGIAAAQQQATRAAPGAASNPAAPHQAAERAILARASAEARLVQIQNTGKNALAGLTQAQAIYQAALAKVDQTSIAAIRTQTQLAAVQNRIAQQSGGGLPVLPRTLEAFGGQALDQVKSGLLGVIGPAALATGAITAVKSALDFTEESFKLKAALDQTNAAITIQLRGVRDSGETFAQASAFARRYSLTQEETNQALRASVGILRQSTAGADDLLGVLSRLQVLSPEQGLEGAALAVKELASGSTQSLVGRFEVSRTAANKMKDAIAAGADSVQVLGEYLDSVGVTMDTLAVRTQGATGKMNELRQEGEQLKLALAGQSGGLGEAILDFRTILTRGATRLLGGEGGIAEGLKQGGASFAALAAAASAYAAAVARGADGTEAYRAAAVAANQAATDFVGTQQQWTSGGGPLVTTTKAVTNALVDETQKTLEAKQASDDLKTAQTGLADIGAAVRAGLITSGEGATILAGALQLPIDKARELLSLQNQIAGRAADTQATIARGIARAGATDIGKKDIDVFGLPSAEQVRQSQQTIQQANDVGRRIMQDNANAAQEAARLADLQLQNRLINAKTAAQKIAVLQEQLTATTDPIERQQLQNQIDQERQAGAGRVGAARTTADQLANLARTSGDDRLRIERENLERLRDQEDDYNVRRARSQEDYERKRRRLLAEGKIAEAKRLKEDFALDQQRNLEDFQRDRARTRRNNAEALGDLGTRVENRTLAIGDAARRKGVTVANTAPLDGGAIPIDLPPAAGATGGRVIQVGIAATVTLDGQAVGHLIFPAIQQQIDAELALELRSVGVVLPPGGGQGAGVSGAAP